MIFLKRFFYREKKEIFFFRKMPPFSIEKKEILF